MQLVNSKIKLELEVKLSKEQPYETPKLKVKVKFYMACLRTQINKMQLDQLHRQTACSLKHDLQVMLWWQCQMDPLPLFLLRSWTQSLQDSLLSTLMSKSSKNSIWIVQHQVCITPYVTILLTPKFLLTTSWPQMLEGGSLTLIGKVRVFTSKKSQSTTTVVKYSSQ
jgi:hypothetical protein